MSEAKNSDDSDQLSERRLTLKSLGVTLSALVLSIGVTVGFGVKGEWWLRVIAGVGTTLLLALFVRVGSGEHGVLTRLANWITRG